MGTHPNGCSSVEGGNGEEDIPLDEFVMSKFSSPLPYLFKVLSIQKSLSIQV